MANIDVQLYNSDKNAIYPRTVPRIINFATDDNGGSMTLKEFCEAIIKCIDPATDVSLGRNCLLYNFNKTTGYVSVAAAIEGLYSAIQILTGNADANGVIDKWKEVENFLNGISDTETLTGLLNDLKETCEKYTDDKVAANSGNVDLSSIENDIATLKSNVSSLQNSVSGNTTSINNLNSSVSSINSNIDTINNTISTLQSTLSTLQSTVDKIDSLYLKLTGGTLTGNLVVGSTSVQTGSSGIKLPSGVTIY